MKPSRKDLYELGRLFERHSRIRAELSESRLADWIEFIISVALLFVSLLFDPPDNPVGRYLFLGGVVVFLRPCYQRIKHIIRIGQLQDQLFLIQKEIDRLKRKYDLPD